MKKIVIIMLISLILPTACNTGRKTNAEKTSTADDGIDSTFQYKVDRFADIEILRYPVPGFNALSLQQKELIYYLSQAALEGRDILYDQHNKYNLAIRRVLEGCMKIIWETNRPKIGKIWRLSQTDMDGQRHSSSLFRRQNHAEILEGIFCIGSEIGRSRTDAFPRRYNCR